MNKKYWIFCIVLIFVGLQFSSCFLFSSNNTVLLSESEFLKKVENHEIKSVTFVTNTGYAEVKLNNSTKDTPSFIHYYSNYQDLNEKIRLKNPDNYQIIIEARAENRSCLFPF